MEKEKQKSDKEIKPEIKEKNDKSKDERDKENQTDEDGSYSTLKPERNEEKDKHKSDKDIKPETNEKEERDKDKEGGSDKDRGDEKEKEEDDKGKEERNKESKSDKEAEKQSNNNDKDAEKGNNDKDEKRKVVDVLVPGLESLMGMPMMGILVNETVDTLHNKIGENEIHIFGFNILPHNNKVVGSNFDPLRTKS